MMIQSMARVKVMDKEAYFEKILEHARVHVPLELHSDFMTYIRGYFAKISYERLAKLEPEEHGRHLLSLWSFFQKRVFNEPKIQVYYWHSESHSPFISDRIVIEMINDDRPFLVDSLLGLLSRLGLKPRQIIHPIFTVRRSEDGTFCSFEPRGTLSDDTRPESMIHCEIVESATPEILEAIQKQLPLVLQDVTLATDDWIAIRAKVDQAREDLTKKQGQDDDQDLDHFLKWLQKDHFTFLGYAYFDLYNENHKLLKEPKAYESLGVLKNKEQCRLDVIFEGLNYLNSTRRLLFDDQTLLINKTTTVSNVHRAVPMDAVGIKRFDENGHILGVHLFLGLFTSIAYDSSARDIPYLSKKIDQILLKAELSSEWHDGKALVHILDSLPRDELFQASVDDLTQISSSILYLREHPRVVLFVRSDIFNRYLSCLVYIPRDRFDSELVYTIGEVLAQELDGDVSLTKAQFGSLDFARVHYTINLPHKKAPIYDFDLLEKKLIDLARSWKDDLRLYLQDHLSEWRSARLYRMYRSAFSKSYQERFHGVTILEDILKCEDVYATGLYTGHISTNTSHEGALCFKLYHPEKPMALSNILPQLENLAFRVISEIPFKITPDGASYPVWMHEFELHFEGVDHAAILESSGQLLETIYKIRDKAIEDDPFNKLVLMAQMTWRQVELSRAYGKYLRQLDIPFGQKTIQQALLNHPHITKNIVELFELKMDPLNPVFDEKKKNAIQDALDHVHSPDDDRILRRYLNLVESTIRTNYFQKTEKDQFKPCLSFKFDGRLLQEIPLPKPLYEIFVYSPKMEAVHLRGGKVARGGIRWSDRFEDYRTEILGLMKAQMVKNAVIVPVGSKGGFVVKTLTPNMNREEVLAEGIAAYQMMIQGMLDITDNWVHGAIKPPDKTARWDDDDPYLVVAADKGTATFSDYSNALSQNNGYWLDDAFASGGSTGYDHKKMGITAKGAWESVRRHFREMGINPEKDPITVIAIGDMSGDVFGNGMLCSSSMKVVAAFNHQHIFIDPQPDAGVSYEERQRLFQLTRSSWKEYDANLISKGGGIYEKSSKNIPISSQLKELIGVDEESLTPDELVKSLLKAPVDLLWFGGIGTFIKGAHQSHAEVGDRSNDAVRINGKEVRARVIAEGANLGMTHLGRIEYARFCHGHLNTDAIDNSAGVDCSDHEVNIKILLNTVMNQGVLDREQRNHLLSSMTKDVGSLVLKDNYLQNFCISMMQSLGPGALDGHIRLIRDLEKRGRLNRGLEYLPEDVTLLEMQSAQVGLTRPELSVVLAYAKLFVYEELLQGDLLDDPFLSHDLMAYFPEVLRKEYTGAIEAHPLRREIIATSLSNQAINRAGASFVHDLMEKTGHGVDAIIKAYIIVIHVLQLPDLWKELESYDGVMLANEYMRVYLDIMRLLRRATNWLLRQMPLEGPIEPLMDRLYGGVYMYLRDLEICLNADAKERYTHLIQHYSALGLQEGCALRLATLRMAAESPDILLIGEKTNTSILEVARLYFIITSRFQFSFIRQQLEELHTSNAWSRQVISGLMEDVYSIQSQAVLSVLNYARQENLALKDAEERVFQRWKKSYETLMVRYDHLMSDAKASGLKEVMVFIPLIREIRLLFENVSKNIWK